MMTITWTPEAEQQMLTINQAYPFDVNAFKNQVQEWIAKDYRSWPNGSSHSNEFEVTGPTSLTAKVASQIRNVTDYFEIVTEVYRD